ncbi:MAG: hypothetical protein HGB15_00405 [Chlorobaculum sp.]|nr:hypothetical protein [Chlorobaculum sp.]
MKLKIVISALKAKNGFPIGGLETRSALKKCRNVTTFGVERGFQVVPDTGR